MSNRWYILCLYAGGLALAALLLVQHWVHVSPFLPALVLLACPLMHVFMHRGHGHHDRKNPTSGHGQTPP